MEPDDIGTVIIRDTPFKLWHIALMAAETANLFSGRKSTTVVYYGKYKAKTIKNKNSFTVRVSENADE